MPEIDYTQYSKDTLERLLLETRNIDEAERIASELKKRGTEDLLKSINSKPSESKAYQPRANKPKQPNPETSAPNIQSNTKSKSTNPTVQSQSAPVFVQGQESGVSIPIVRRFLLFCSGAKISILSRKDCVTEQSKYEMIGITIFFTAVLASLSGGYALFTVFQSLKLSSAFGVFWGAIILNLDRFIVANIKKGKNNFFQQILIAFPRLILAIFLAIVITKPLELKLFSKEIEAEIAKRNEAVINEARDLLSQKLSQNPVMIRLQNDRNGINAEIKEIEGKIAYWRTRSIPNNEEITRLESLRNEREQSLISLSNQINDLDKQNSASLERIQSAQQDSRSLLTQLATLEKLSSADQIIRNISIFVTLIFVTLEISPVLVKILSRYGIYDAILENEEESISYFYANKTLEAKLSVDHELESYKEMLKKESNDYTVLRASMRKFDMDQELESYKIMRKNLQELINQQFAEILDQISTDPNFSVIQYKATDEVLRHLENGLLKYSEGVQFADNEMLEFLEKVKHQVKTSIFDHGSKQVVNNQSNKN